MLFEQMRRNFLEMEFEDRLAFLTTYVERRTEELKRVELKVMAPKTTKVKNKQLKLTSAQLDLLKKMGLLG